MDYRDFGGDLKNYFKSNPAYQDPASLALLSNIEVLNKRIDKMQKQIDALSYLISIDKENK